MYCTQVQAPPQSRSTCGFQSALDVTKDEPSHSILNKSQQSQPLRAISLSSPTEPALANEIDRASRPNTACHVPHNRSQSHIANHIANHTHIALMSEPRSMLCRGALYPASSRRYKLLGVIGRGAFSEVWVALDNKPEKGRCDSSFSPHLWRILTLSI